MPSQRLCGVSPLGISIAASALTFLNIITVCTFIVILFVLIKSRKKVLKELHRVKRIKHPAVYEELDYIVPPVNINVKTEENVAYLTKSDSH